MVRLTEIAQDLLVILRVLAAELVGTSILHIGSEGSDSKVHHLSTRKLKTKQQERKTTERWFLREQKCEITRASHSFIKYHSFLLRTVASDTPVPFIININMTYHPVPRPRAHFQRSFEIFCFGNIEGDKLLVKVLDNGKIKAKR